MKKNLRLPCEKRLPDGSYLSRVYQSPKDLRHGVNGVVVRVIEFHLADVDLLHLIDAADQDPDSDAAIESLLAPCLADRGDGITAAFLVAKAREIGTLSELRDSLGLDYRGFNASLAALGRPYAPFHNAEGQQFAFAAHLASRRSSIVDSLRAAHITAFDTGADLVAYGSAIAEFTRALHRRSRSADAVVPVLEPLPGWVEEHHVPPDEAMDERVDDWLRSVGADPRATANLRSLDDVRASNRRILGAIVDRARPILGAWCGKYSDVDPPGWARADPTDDLIERFAVAGRIDFRELGEAGIVDTLVRWGEWPEGMPSALEIDDLGLSPKDLADQQSSDERARWIRDQERRTVTLDGRRVSLEPSHAEELIALVRSGITPAFLATRVRTAGLEALGPVRGPRGGGGGRSPFRGGRLSEAKAQAIGFIGELVAYDWLVAQFSIGPEGWVSANRRFLFPDDAGDDGLGYDFLVPRRRGRPWLFEVKSASDPEAEAFELSEAEIRAAQEHAGKGEFQILFIRDVLNSATRTVHVLPNPLDSGSHGRYRVVGTGIRYAFRLGVP